MHCRVRPKSRWSARVAGSAMSAPGREPTLNRASCFRYHKAGIVLDPRNKEAGEGIAEFIRQ